METRNVTITLDKAREWYKSGNTSLEEIALQAFSKEELNPFDFTKIKTFRDALNALDYSGYDMQKIMDKTESISYYSRASATMIKLNIIRKALNLGQNLHLIKDLKDSRIYYCPYNPFVTESSPFYKSAIDNCKMEVIGSIMSERTLYNVLGGDADDCGTTGLVTFIIILVFTESAFLY